jgi:hypothetical protein
VGVRPFVAHRRFCTIRRVIQNVPSASAIPIYAGVTAAAIHSGASVKMLGAGNATVTNISTTPMPITFAVMMKTVMMT